MTVLADTANTPAAWSARAQAGTSWERCGWSRESQSERFDRVAAAVHAFPGERLLDFGCGDGAFCELLPAGVDYVGFDWAEGMIDRARAEHPGRTFMVDQPGAGASFDVVVCIGAFNLPGSKQATWHTLRHLWDVYEPRVLAVSLYAGDDDRCLIYTEDEALAAVRGFSWRVTVERWRRNDVLAVVHR